ncbi:conserved hypothetical protein [Theileria orientalis strain Shintoku]|uniref:Uncharacterized protein n=1 Tax=Theileria orientalis strain Shintoku TaxID=869250 RepID=J4C370_THEOR|nr:conserved hypothetical protein [Theileria orientalis strain Shintoku]BAM39926.1 conserved hypothetical protein [Theileria orientalis strain Shintoku]|eukprot:XP_009690227.1 conserved hypothetical protein [Theileria orientalis strain Shintoku]
MKIYDLLCVVYFGCTIEIAKSVGNQNFNIGDVTKDYLLMKLVQRIGKITIITYVTRMRSRIVKVMDGAIIIWEAKTNGEYLSLLKIYKYYGRNKLAYVYSLGNLVRKTKFFEGRKHNWYEIPEFYFDYKLERLRKERIFDLKSDIDYDTFYVQDLSLYGLETLVFIPYDIYDIISVCDDFDVIWERNNDSDKCTCIIVHGDLRNSQLIHLHLKINNTHKQMFMRKYEDDWKQTDKTNFYSFLKKLDNVDTPF